METLILIALVALVVIGLSNAAAASLWHLALLVATVFGIWKAFQANIFLGIIAIIFSPVGLIIGVASLIAKRNVAYDIVRAFGG